MCRTGLSVTVNLREAPVMTSADAATNVTILYELQSRRRTWKIQSVTRTVGTPSVSLAFNLIQSQSSALVDAEMTINFIHALDVSVLHGLDRRRIPTARKKSALVRKTHTHWHQASTTMRDGGKVGMSQCTFHTRRQMRKTLGSLDHPGWYRLVPQRTGSQRKPRGKDPCLAHHIHPPSKPRPAWKCDGWPVSRSFSPVQWWLAAAFTLVLSQAAHYCLPAACGRLWLDGECPGSPSRSNRSSLARTALTLIAETFAHWFNGMSLGAGVELSPRPSSAGRRSNPQVNAILGKLSTALFSDFVWFLISLLAYWNMVSPFFAIYQYY